MSEAINFVAALEYARAFERPLVEDDPQMTNLARAFLALHGEQERCCWKRAGYPEQPCSCDVCGDHLRKEATP